ncbi:MAG: hypothetical protein ACOY5F_08715 [Pseudomonadota bacterium]|jgi:hypothetical protein
MAEKHSAGIGLDTLYATLTRRWDSKTVESFASALSNQDPAETAGMSAAFQAIDSKATGLLTHVSMMIAGLGICLPMLGRHWTTEIIIIGEIAVYLLIAVGCLRCLSVMRSLYQHASGADTRVIMRRELIVRHELYRLCNKISIYFTILVFFSLPLLLWIRPTS